MRGCLRAPECSRRVGWVARRLGTAERALRHAPLLSSPRAPGAPTPRLGLWPGDRVFEFLLRLGDRVSENVTHPVKGVTHPSGARTSHYWVSPGGPALGYPRQSKMVISSWGLSLTPPDWMRSASSGDAPPPVPAHPTGRRKVHLLAPAGLGLCVRCLCYLALPSLTSTLSCQSTGSGKWPFGPACLSWTQLETGEAAETPAGTHRRW